jgi:glycosyltransferase involved in cell wall biosynthesis
VQAAVGASAINRLHALPGLWWLYYAAYRRWQRQAFELAARMHGENPFDVAHHLTIIGYREPGYLWRLGIPFFWGPLTGAEMVPWQYFPDFGPKECFRWGSRNVLNRFQMRMSKRCRKAAAAAAKIWVVSKRDREMVEALWGQKNVEQLNETAVPDGVPVRVRTRDPGHPLRIGWSGLFQGIKVLPILLRALAQVGRQGWEMEVMGDGPERTRWEKIAGELGLSGAVRFHGYLPREQAISVMSGCDVFFHTSIKEGTPHVVLEALGMGMPVVCHDTSGMAVAVDERCGLKVPLVSPGESISGFASAVSRFLREPELLERLSKGAIQRAGELSWDGKARVFSEAYRGSVA